MLSIIAFILTDIIDLLFLLIFDFVLIFITKVPVFSKQFIKIIIGFLLANLSIFIGWLLFSGRVGNIILFETEIVLIKDIWIWHILITDQTLYYASRTYLRSIIMFFLVLFFFIGTSDRDLINGLRSIKVPFAACLMIDITFRGLSMFLSDYHAVKEAMKTRGVDFEGSSLIQKIRNFISIFIALIILMFKRTEEMSSSIEARGIPVRAKNRTIYHYFPLKFVDVLIITVLTLFLIVSIYLNISNTTIVSSIQGLI